MAKAEKSIYVSPTLIQIIGDTNFRVVGQNGGSVTLQSTKFNNQIKLQKVTDPATIPADGIVVGAEVDIKTLVRVTFDKKGASKKLDNAEKHESQTGSTRQTPSKVTHHSLV